METKNVVVIDKPKEIISAWEFPVSIGKRRYSVTLQKTYWRDLTNEAISARELIFRSVLFLLEREPKESILSSFDMQEINNYFPEYEQEMKRQLTNAS